MYFLTAVQIGQFDFLIKRQSELYFKLLINKLVLFLLFFVFKFKIQLTSGIYLSHLKNTQQFLAKSSKPNNNL